MTGIRKSISILQQPSDSASLAVFRILFGSLMALGMFRFLALGWVEELFIAPHFHFTYAGFHWIQPWPEPWMSLHVAAVGGFALSLALGFYTRVSALLFFLGFTYLELIDKTTYLNHYYFISLISFWLIFLPSENSYSIDALRKSHPKEIAFGFILFLQLHLALVYLYAGLGKINSDWLFEAQPLKIWLAARTDLPLLGSFFSLEATAYLMSWAGALYDLTIPAFLWWSRSRPYAYLTVIGFHVMTAILFPIGLFPWIMIALTTIFFAPSWPRRWQPDKLLTPNESHTTLRPVLTFSMALYLVIQCLVPLRHHLLTNDVFWTEHGYRFSWNVMLIEKGGHVDFSVIDPRSQAVHSIDIDEHLTPQQARMMRTQPDMILDFAHYLKDTYSEKFQTVPEVRANAWISLNGRPSQPLISPKTNLAQIASRWDLEQHLSPRNP